MLQVHSPASSPKIIKITVGEYLTATAEPFTRPCRHRTDHQPPPLTLMELRFRLGTGDVGGDRKIRAKKPIDVCAYVVRRLWDAMFGGGFCPRRGSCFSTL